MVSTRRTKRPSFDADAGTSISTPRTARAKRKSVGDQSNAQSQTSSRSQQDDMKDQTDQPLSDSSSQQQQNHEDSGNHVDSTRHDAHPPDLSVPDSSSPVLHITHQLSSAPSSVDGHSDVDDDDASVDDAMTVEDDEFDFDVDREPLPDNDERERTQSQHKKKPWMENADEVDGDDDDLLPHEEEASASTESTHRSFGATLHALLTQAVPDVLNPVLSAASAVRSLPVVPPELRAARAARLKHKAKLLWKNKDHHLPEITPQERQYAQIATRGVVQLFNAVQQQKKAQRLKNDAEAAAMQKEAAAKTAAGAGAGARSDTQQTSKEGFMKLLRQAGTTVPSTTSTTAAASVASVSIQATAKPRPPAGWSILSDDYLLNSKLTDWDKQINSDDEEAEEEDEDERSREAEVDVQREYELA